MRQPHRHRAKINAASSQGFAIAPILYLLGLIGVGAGVLFSGYSQILRSNQTMANIMSAKNDLQGTATTLAASSWLSTDQTLLCPPLIGSHSPLTPAVKCSSASGAITVGTSFASAVATNLPANFASVSSAGSPVEVGVFAAGSGAKVLDPWGHYYIYCRWENAIGTSNALMVISAGPNGKIESTCGSTTAGGDDLFVVWTTAVTQNHAAVWQTTTSGTSVTGTQFGATGSQIQIDTAGDVTIPGTLAVTGATTLGTAGLTVNGPTSFTDGVSGTTGTFTGLLSGGSLNITGTSTLNGLSAGSSTLSSLSVTNNATFGGTLGVTGNTTLTGSLTAGSSTLSSLSVTGTSYLGGITSTGAAVDVGTSIAASGTSAPLFTVGKAVSSVYPFTVDQYGAVTGGAFTGTTFNGNLNGNQSGGSVAASTLSASAATTLGGTLGVTGITTLSAQLNGTSAVFTGSVQAASFVGSMTIGGGGMTLSGVVPIANGGTGQSTAANALAALGVTSGGYLNLGLLTSNLIPGADIVSGSVTSTQLNTTGVTAGTYTSVTVSADGRVTAGSNGTNTSVTDGSGDSVSVGTTAGILFDVGSSVVGNWTAPGLMVGTSKAALDKLDVYGSTAIGTGYAGTTAAPTNGLIVQGNVGIGTNNPLSFALDVSGGINATSFTGSGAGLTGIGTSAITGTMGPGSGGTGTSTVFTQGSVVFAGASGIYNQDNANFFWDDTHHYLGIGTATPAAALDVYGGMDINGQNAIAYPSSDTTAGGSVAIGVSALGYQATSAAYKNTAIGYQALDSSGMTSSAINNVVIGYQSGTSITSANNDVYIGYNVASGSTNSSNSVAIGASSYAGGSDATAVGASSYVGGGNSVAIGFNAGAYSGGVSVGHEAGNAHGGSATLGTLVGYQAGRYLSATGLHSTALGYNALLGVSGSGVTASGNTAIGDSALAATITTAANNTALGYQAGSLITTGGSNVVIGPGVASTTLTTGSNNILIGTNAGVDTGTSSTSNTLDIGNLIYGTGLATSGTTPTGNVGIGTVSPVTALQVVGTVTATNFSGSGAGLTSISATGLSGVVPIANGGTNVASQTTNGVNYFNGTSITSGTGFVYTGGDVGIGNTGPLATLSVGAMNNNTNNSTAFIAGSPVLAGTLNAMDYVGEFRSTSNNQDRLLFAEHRTVGSGTDWTTAAWRIQPAVDNSFTGVNSNRGYLEFAYGSADSYTGIGLSGQGNTAPDMVVNGSGNVGIGTTSPSYLLDSESTANNIFQVVGIGTGYGGSLLARVYSQRTVTGTDGLFQAGSAYAPNALYVQDSGKVGIGTASPQSMMHVYGGEVQVGSSSLSCTAANAGAIRYATGALYYCDNASTWETLDSSGSGNNGDWEEVTQAAPNPTGTSQGYFGANATYGAMLSGDGSVSDVTLENKSGTPALEVLTGTTNLYAPGNVGIGTTNPLTTLDVYGNGAALQLFTTGNNTYSASSANQADIVIGSNNFGGTRHDSSIMLWDTGTAERILGHGGNFYLSAWNADALTAANVMLGGVVGSASYFQGNVGIGTTNPGAQLELKSASANNTTYEQLRLRNDGTGNGGGSSITFDQFGYTMGQIQAQYQATNGWTMSLGVDTNLTALNIIQDGDVGIGTATPGYTLDVSGLVREHNTTNENVIIGGNLDLSSGSTIRSVNDAVSAYQPLEFGASQYYFATGNVGIGVTSPGAKLTVGNAAGGTAVSTLFTVEPASALSNTAGTDINLGSFAFGDSSNTTSLGIHAYRVSTGPGWATEAIGLGMDVDNTVRAGPAVWLSGNGKVGIGTTAPQSLLHIQAGEVQTGTSGNACAAANAGAIRYASGVLYFCDNASTWETLDSSGSGNNGDWEEVTQAAPNPTGTSQGYFGASATLGAVLSGDGSVSDLTLENHSGSAVLEIPTGTTNLYALGNVGIGTNTPGAPLQVWGASAAPSNAASTTISIGNPNGAGNSGGLGLGYYASNYNWIQSFTSMPLYINPLGNNTILNSGSGLVGIGTTVPNAVLHVRAGTNEDMLLTAHNNFSSGVNIAAVNDAGSANIPLEFDGSQFGFFGGNVGIGTATPGATLTVGNNVFEVTSGGAVTDTGETVNGTASATLFSGSGASLTSLNASNLSSGTVATARLGSGTASATTFLAGNQTWAVPTPTFSGLTSGDFCTASGTTAIVCSTGSTGTGSVVLATSPTIASPTISGNITLSATNPAITSGGSYTTIPYGIYASGGTSYFQTSTNFRAGIANDTGAYLTISGGTSGYTDFTGNVGIGTPTPLAPVDVYGAGNTSVATAVPYWNVTATQSANVDSELNYDTISAVSGQTREALGLDYMYITPGAALSQSMFGRSTQVQIAASNTYTLSGTIAGMQAIANNWGTGSVGSLVGTEGISYNEGATTVTGQYSGYFIGGNASASGIVTTQYGVNIGYTNVGTVTNGYGLYVSGYGTGGTWTNKAYDVYAADSGVYNYFAGNVGIGSTTPGYSLTVSGRVASGAAGTGGIWVDGGSQQFFGSVSSSVMGIYNNGWVLNVSNGGNVGINTTSTAYKLEAVNSVGGFGTAASHFIDSLNYSPALDVVSSTVEAGVFAAGHYPVSEPSYVLGDLNTGFYGYVPTGGHGAGASAAIFDRPDANLRMVFMGGKQVGDSTYAAKLFNTSTSATLFTIDTSGNLVASGSLTAGGIAYPATNGTSGYFLQTNGSGTASWQPAVPTFSGLTSSDFCTASGTTTIVCSTGSTGTGSVVLAVSPTLTGTVTGAASNWSSTFNQYGAFGYLGNFNSTALPTGNSPSGTPGLAASWNQSGGSGEVDLWNTYYSAGSGATAFIFKQMLTSSTAATVMTISGAGSVTIPGNLTLGGTTINGPGSSSTYGAITVSGSKGGWGGINFNSGGNMATLMVSGDNFGFFNAANSGWDFYWTGGTLSTGTVPAANVSAGSFGAGSYTVSSNLTVSSTLYSGAHEQAIGAYLYPGCDGATGCSANQASYYLYSNFPNSAIQTNGGFVVAGSLTTGGNVVSDSNIYFGSGGVWLSSWLNQAVTSGSSPNFYNPYIGYLGNNLSVFINQAVLTTSAPTFAGLTLSGTLTMNSNINVSTGHYYEYNGSAVLWAQTGLNSNYLGYNSGNVSATGGAGGGYNTGLGTSTLPGLSTGYYDTAVGALALGGNTSGYSNTAVGLEASYLNQGGYDNTAVGEVALYTNNGGANNSAFGASALYYLTSGSQNVGIGFQGGYEVTSGSNNIFIGYLSGYINSAGTATAVTGNNNIVIGPGSNMLPTGGGSSQLNIGNLVFGSNLATSTTIDTCCVGIGMLPNASSVTLDVMAPNTNGAGNLQTYAGLRIDEANNNVVLIEGVDYTNSLAYIQSMQPNVNWSNRGLVLQPNGGMVGIGVTPTQALQVNGNAQVSANIYLGTEGVWLSSWLNQSVASGSSPNFYNPYIGYMGNNMSVFFNQAVLTTSSPSFASVYAGAFYDSVNSGYYTQPRAGSRMSSVYFDTALIGWSGYNGITQAQGNYLHPGCDSSCGNWQETYYLYANTTYGIVDSSGLYIAGNAYAANYYHTSDRRLKTNIKPVAGLSIVEKLNGVTFNWKKDGKPSAGIIAQDVEKVLPEAIFKDDKGMLMVSYDTLIGPIIESIKELKAMLVALEAKFDAVAAKVQVHDDSIVKLEADNDNLRAALKASNDNLAADEARLKIIEDKLAITPQGKGAARPLR